MNRKSILIWAMAIGTLSSCMENDLYDAEAVREKAEKAFGMAIDPNQDWNMIKTVKANISIKEDALSNYKFKIYTANPLFAESGAALLAEKSVSTDAKGNANAELTFDMPSYMEYVYVARVDDHGRRLVKSAEVDNGTLNTEFGESTVGTRTAVTESDLSSTKKPCPYTEDEVAKMIREGYNVNDGLNHAIGGAYDWNDPKTINTLSDIEKITWQKGTTKPHTLVVTSNYEETLSLELSRWNMYPKFVSTHEEKIWIDGENGREEIPVDVPTFEYPQITPHDFKVVISKNPETSASTTYTLKGNGSGKKIGCVDIIVADGGILDIQDELLMQADSRIIVMPGGKVIDNRPDGKTFNFQGELIYNAGTMNIKNFDSTSDTGNLVYNAESGIITSTDIKFSNSNVVLTNWGKIETTTITGSNDSDWGQGTVNNGCLLRVTDVFRAANLNQAGGTAIECKEMRINGNLTMRENSILRAEILKMQNLDIQYCSEQGHALISTKCMAQFESDVTINGAFYFEVGEFGTAKNTEQRKKDMEGWLTSAISGTNSTLSAVGEAPLAIDPEGLSRPDCIGNGNTPNNQGGGGNENPSYFTYAFEDQNKDGGDYDMNDVVLYCSAPKDGKITVRLVAAGASKNLTVHFKNKQANTDVALFNGSEVHDLFKVEKKVLVNTGAGPNCAEISAEIEVGEGFSYLAYGDFYIKDEQKRESHTPAFDAQLKERGNVPYGICVPKEWKYPKERCGIQYAYPGFETWAGDMNSSQNWYETGVSDNIYKKAE